MKEFAIKVGKDLLEGAILILFGIMMFPWVLKFMEYILSLYGYTF
ncbi:hypothetical protein ANS017_13190 [Paraclostridium bifermentans]|nr:hypothetical protein [Paraclostridium bifermentans]GKZ02637.1 hypothetical protein ANS014_10710 [Paraclostridium bifermentans]GKZ07406.1 hypothetical protein ANS015_22890 [Paraclostridium bifermentans]GKZ09935.1 hypothetical protein ANS017_13190 [Paraclostridium bifermentans]